MAGILISVIAEGILKKLFLLASEEVSLHWGLKEDTEKLAEKMQMVQALLCDVENKPLLKSAAIALWIEKLKDIALDADNVLDELSYEAVRLKVEVRDSKRNKVRNFFSSSNTLAFRRKLGTKIKNINKLLDELNHEASGIGLIGAEFVNAPVGLYEIVQTGPFVDDSGIVGRSKDISSIVGWLVNYKDEEELSVIGIVGMPGQGKTTVAQLVYKSDEVVRNFDHRLWVCVSDNFSVDRLLNEMVEAMTQSRSEMTNREALVKKLQGMISNKRFLLVLDDVWNKNRAKWNSMRSCLLEVGGSSGSKIMITTRSEDVCLTMQTCLTHRLDTLSDEESWILFSRVAFADGGAMEAPGFISIGKRVLSRCGGVPLAVKALAGLLYAKRDEREWLSIERSELWNSSVGEDTVLPSLRLSYNHLPSLSLKQCFGFCSLFPKDSVMEKDKLIQLWIAQGFLNCSKVNKIEMEDVGSNYLNILLQNSLLQVDKKDDYGNMSTFKMHDLVHDLALDVSKNYCLLTDSWDDVNENIKVVNLSLISGEKTLEVMNNVNSLRLRTLFFGGGGGLHGDLLKKFRKLRILVLSSSAIFELPNSIGKLRHLRLLDVSETKMIGVPQSLTKLYNLQTLRFHALEILPENFGNFVNLRHFYIQNTELSDDDKPKCLLPGIGKLKFLQSIPYFVVSQEEGCRINELKGLTSLCGYLRIYGLEMLRNGDEAMEANLEGKPNIHTLEYHWTSREAAAYYVNDEDVLEFMQPHSNIKGITIGGYHASSFPSWIMGHSCSSLLRNLVKIAFEYCDMCTQLPPLGCLPCLRIVKVLGMDSVSFIGNEFYGLDYLTGTDNIVNEITVFPALKQLELSSMDFLEAWLDIDRSQCSHLGIKEFPHLEELVISLCSDLNYLRDMRSLTSLQKLRIAFCRKLLLLPDDIGMLESLESLRIEYCSDLVMLPDIHRLRSLRYLCIESCPSVTYLPFGIENLKLLQDLRVVGLPELVEFPDVGGLQSLRWLDIEDCQNLNSLPSGLELCTLLDYVIVRGCSFLLLEGLRCLARLRKLVLGPFSNDFEYFPWFCAENSDGNDNFGHHFASLETLTLYGWPKLTSLPQELQFYSLTYLSIIEFNGLLDLPEWLGNIKSLQTIRIWRCHNLMYFPSAKAMQSLKNLQKLEIVDCPLLEERCAAGTGPEWHKIAHIPALKIRADLK